MIHTSNLKVNLSPTETRRAEGGDLRFEIGDLKLSEAGKFLSRLSQSGLFQISNLKSPPGGHEDNGRQPA
jgi:hypothetical protein